MDILSWNIDFWERKTNVNWINFTRFLMQMDFEFILLQEINPFYIYGIQDKEKYRIIHNEPIYGFSLSNKSIFYHELFNVLSDERPHDAPINYWGTTIITNNKTEMVKNHLYKSNE